MLASGALLLMDKMLSVPLFEQYMRVNSDGFILLQKETNSLCDSAATENFKHFSKFTCRVSSMCFG